MHGAGGMKFLVQAWSSGARAGSLLLGELQLETPCLLMLTRKGLPAFITHDLLENLHPDACALQVSPIHFLEGPPPNIVASVGGIHKLLCLHKRAVVGIARDSLGFETDGENGTKFGAAFETSAGRRVVTPQKYMEAVNAMKPDIWAALPDEVPAWVTTKRNRVSVDRTIQWLDECLSLNTVQNSNALGVVVGGSDVEQRKRSAQATALRNVAGFSVGGFGLGESPEERGHLLGSTIECLPQEKVRHISGLGMPEEVLEAVAGGIDLFDSIYPHTLTMGGFAMIFSVTMEQKNGYHDVPSVEMPYTGGDSGKINLHSVIHRCDTSPIMKGCNCYSCRKHTRAYIHHLLNVHEMLAQTLLDIHNYHHYFSFFRAIRESIARDKFQTYRNWFISRRRCTAAAHSLDRKKLDSEGSLIKKSSFVKQ